MERIEQKDLESIIRDSVLTPLKLTSITYTPHKYGLAEKCAPTEMCKWRNRRVQGEVHDENAASFAGLQFCVK